MVALASAEDGDASFNVEEIVGDLSEAEEEEEEEEVSEEEANKENTPPGGYVDVCRDEDYVLLASPILPQANQSV